MPRLTKPLLDAMASALDAALAGDGFDGGDFDGMNPEAFERAREWVMQEQQRRGQHSRSSPHGYRDPKTAPRDGTIIIGLFEPPRGKKKRVTYEAAYDADFADPTPPSDSDPAWMHKSHHEIMALLESDPAFAFRPLSDSDHAIAVGRMVGWKPLSR